MKKNLHKLCLATNRNHIFIRDGSLAKSRHLGKYWMRHHCTSACSPVRRRGEFLKSFRENEERLWCFERTGEGWKDTDHNEKMIKPKGIEAVYPAAQRCFISLCQSLMEIQQMRINTCRNTQTYTPSLLFTMWPQCFACWLLWMILDYPVWVRPQ